MNKGDLDIKNEFISQNNKFIVWETLVNNNLFNGVPDRYANNIKADFEACLQRIKLESVATDSVLLLNKKAILNIIERIQLYRQEPVTSADVLSKKEAQFHKGLQTKQEEFNSLMQPIKPQSIDFSDKIVDDDPIGSDMDNKLNETIAWRERQLRQVLEQQNPAKASEWITNGQKSIVSTIHKSNNIVIGDTTKIDESNIINLKKVSFSIEYTNKIDTNKIDTNKIDTNKIDTNTYNNTYNFMEKLKKKNTVEEINIDMTLTLAFDKFKSELNNFMVQLEKNREDHTKFKAEMNKFNTNFSEDLKNVAENIKIMSKDINKIAEDIKNIQGGNSEKIMDMLEKISFQTGNIE